MLTPSSVDLTNCRTTLPVMCLLGSYILVERFRMTKVLKSKQITRKVSVRPKQYCLESTHPLLFKRWRWMKIKSRRYRAREKITRYKKRTANRSQQQGQNRVANRKTHPKLSKHKSPSVPSRHDIRPSTSGKGTINTPRICVNRICVNDNDRGQRNFVRTFVDSASSNLLLLSVSKNRYKNNVLRPH